jgi:hypothetical protein
MKKNKLLPILLLAGAGVAAFIYFKNKSKAKELADGVEVEPETEKTDNEEQSSTMNEESETSDNKAAKYIKAGSAIYKKAKQVFKGRKKRKATVIIQPTESSSVPFKETATTRKNRRLAKRTERKTARTAKRATRKKNKVVTGFEF